jgi:hypothetical protein
MASNQDFAISLNGYLECLMRKEGIMEISTTQAPAAVISYEWELHTCKRGHAWRFPKPTDKMRCDLFNFSWTDADGKNISAGTGTLCVQCLREDLVATYGPVKTEIVP